jgi:hypothetical protein
MRSLTKWLPAIAVALAVAALSGPAMAQTGGGGTGFTTTENISFYTVVNPVNFVIAAGTLAAGGLVASMTMGGGFRVLKKVYGWTFGRM